MTKIGTHTPAEAPALEVRDLTVEFRAETGWVRAVDDFSFSVAPGQTLGIVGESGSGKTVSSLALMGLLPAQSARVTGSVRLGGTEILGASRRQLQAVRGSEISMIFQEPMTSLDPAFTVGQQLSEVIRRHRGGSRSAAMERAVETLGLVGMRRPRELVGQYPHEFSGGMRQRVMIAMAIACEPSVLIADEPTTALDVTVQSQILGLLESMRENLGLTVVMITHDIGVVAEFCDDIVVMFQGQQIEGADVRSIFYEPQHPYTADLLAAMPTLDGLRGSVSRATDMERLEVGDGCRYGPRCAHVRPECLGAPVPLEAVGDTLVRCRRAQELELEGVS